MSLLSRSFCVALLRQCQFRHDGFWGTDQCCVLHECNGGCPSPPPTPTACAAVSGCNSGCGEMPHPDYHSMNLAAPTAGQCYWCDKWVSHDAPEWCQYREDNGIWPDKCCVRHNCWGDCAASGRRLEGTEGGGGGAAALPAPQPLGIVANRGMTLSLASGALHSSAAPSSSSSLVRTSGVGGARRELTASGVSACELVLPLAIDFFDAGDNDQVLDSILSHEQFTGWLLSLAHNDIVNVICGSLSEGVSEPFAAMLGQIRLLLEPTGETNDSPTAGEAAVMAAAHAQGVKLVDFETHKLWKAAFSGLHSLLAHKQPNGQPRMNVLVDQFTHGTGTFSLDFLSRLDPMVTAISNIVDVNFTLTNVRVAGLNTFTEFDLFNVLSSHVFRSHIALNTITIEVDFALSLHLGTGAGYQYVSGNTMDIDETFMLSIGLDDLEINLATLLALDETKFDHMQLGTLIDSHGDGRYCLLSIVFGAQLTQLRASIADIVNPALSGFLSRGISTSLTSTTDGLFMMYEPLILERMPALLDTTVRNMTNRMLDSIIPWDEAD